MESKSFSQFTQFPVLLFAKLADAKLALVKASW